MAFRDVCLVEPAPGGDGPVDALLAPRGSGQSVRASCLLTSALSPAVVAWSPASQRWVARSRAAVRRSETVATARPAASRRARLVGQPLRGDADDRCWLGLRASGSSGVWRCKLESWPRRHM